MAASVNRVRAEAHTVTYFPLTCTHNHTTIEAADICAETMRNVARSRPQIAIQRWGSGR